MNLSVILKNFTRQIEAEGSLRAMRWLVDRANTRFQEWRLGIRTEGMIELSELGISNEECKYYSPTEYAGFSQIIHALDINVRDHVFLDFGAGLGRAMILAASYSFRRVVGVEISPELSAKAHENFTRCKRKLRCQNLELVTSDATLFQIPPDVSLVYFNNPFFGKILSSVLANLHNSIKAAPREMIVVCNLPHSCLCIRLKQAQDSPVLFIEDHWSFASIIFFFLFFIHCSSYSVSSVRRSTTSCTRSARRPSLDTNTLTSPLPAVKANKVSCISSGCHDVVHNLRQLDKVKFWSEAN